MASRSKVIGVKLERVPWELFESWLAMNLGEVLQSAREASRLSLDQLAEATSIRAGLLSQMERNDFSHCGGDIYAKGHLRNIAPLIGLEPGRLINLYNTEHSVESRSLSGLLAESSVTKVPSEKRNISWKAPAGVSLAILLIFIVVQIVSSNLNSSPPQPSQVLPSASPSPTPSPTEGVTVQPVDGKVTMTISALRGNSLIHILADGQTLERGPMFQGEIKNFEGVNSISIYFSNPAALDVTVNGELLAPLGGANEEVRRTFR